MLKGIEGAFCSDWEGWDEIDTGDFQFFEPTLHPHIQELLGDFKVTWMAVCTSMSVVQFGNGDPDTVREFKLVVTLGEEV